MLNEWNKELNQKDYMKKLIFKNYKVLNMKPMKEIENIELIYKD